MNISVEIAATEVKRINQVSKLIRTKEEYLKGMKFLKIHKLKNKNKLRIIDCIQNQI